MNESFLNCWEIENCGREKDGANVDHLGECAASRDKMGHSCWAIAGTFCKGKIQGSYAEKIGQCSFCEVYKLYNRAMGSHAKEIIEKLHGENERYKEVMKKNR